MGYIHKFLVSFSCAEIALLLFNDYFTDAFLFNNGGAYKKWDALKVRFGLPSMRNFQHQPRTVTEALQQGFTKMSDCNLSAKWRGARYMKDNDINLILLYDINGYIAGTQFGVPSNQPDGYPHEGQRPPFIEDGPNRFVTTAYFVDPSIICTSGRSSSDFASQGTGTNLYLQNGTNPEVDSVLVPRLQKDLAGTGWLNGKCFPLMGVHYWDNVRGDTSCDSLFPMFLLFRRGVMNGFGWAMNTVMIGPKVEQIVWPLYGVFIRDVPRCLQRPGLMSSQHIYLVNDGEQFTCLGEEIG